MEKIIGRCYVNPFIFKKTQSGNDNNTNNNSFISTPPSLLHCMEHSS